MPEGEKVDLTLTKTQCKKEKNAWFTYISAVIANLIFMSLGQFMSWPSATVQLLRSNNTDVNPLGTPITTFQVSMIVSIPWGGSIFTLIIVSKLSNMVGRKKSLKYIATGLILAFIVMAFATHIYVYYMCLILMAFCYSGTLLNVPIYCSEIAEDKNRAILGCFVGLSAAFGILLGYVSGAIFNSVKNLTLMCGAPAVLFLILSFLVVETPYYLLLKGHHIDAWKSLKTLRKPRSYKDIELEYIHIEECAQANLLIAKKTIFHVLKQKASRKGLYMAIGQILAQQLTGIGFVLSFAIPIFSEITPGLSGKNLAILMGTLNCFFYLLGSYFITKFGRRLLLLVSSLICSICLFLLGLVISLKQIHFQFMEQINWFPVLCLFTFIFAYSIGLGPIPIGMVPEFFSLGLRAAGTCLTFMVATVISGLVEFSFPLLSEAFGLNFIMFLHSALELIAFFMIFFYLPETKGKCYKEIQEILSK